MGWATTAIEKLNKGETVQIRPFGSSMTGKINSGNLVTIAPCSIKELDSGDIVLVKVNGTVYLHLIKAVRGHMYLIGNNKGKINGWTEGKNIYGKVIKVED